MTVSLRESLETVSDPRSLDRSVEEVFHLMLGVDCVRDLALANVEPEAMTAVVGFGGVLSGACIVRCPAQTAIHIAALMTCMSLDEVDDTVREALGEICNMPAAPWMGKVQQLPGHRGLPVPAVITGRDY